VGEYVAELKGKASLDTSGFTAGAAAITAASEKISAAQIKVSNEASRAGDRIFASMKRIQDSITGTKATGELNLIGQAITNLGGTSKLSEEAIARLRAQIDGLARAGGMVPPALQGVVESFKKMEAAAAAQAALKAKQLDLGGMLKGLGTAELQSSASGLGAFGTALSSVGPAGLVAAAGIASVAAAAGGVGAALISSIKAAADYGGRITDLAAKTSLSTDSLQRFEYAGKMVGVSIETIAGAVTKMERTLGTTPQKFEALGLSAANLKALAPEQQFAAVAEALNKIENPAERAAAASAIFGKAWSEIIPLMKQGAAILDEAPIMDAETVAAMDRLGDAFDKVGLASAAFWRNLGAGVATTLNLLPLVEKLAEVLRDVTAAMGVKINGKAPVEIATEAAANAATGGGFSLMGAYNRYFGEAELPGRATVGKGDMGERWKLAGLSSATGSIMGLGPKELVKAAEETKKGATKLSSAAEAQLKTEKKKAEELAKVMDVGSSKKLQGLGMALTHLAPAGEKYQEWGVLGAPMPAGGAKLQGLGASMIGFGPRSGRAETPQTIGTEAGAYFAAMEEKQQGYSWADALGRMANSAQAAGGKIGGLGELMGSLASSGAAGEQWSQSFLGGKKIGQAGAGAEWAKLGKGGKAQAIGQGAMDAISSTIEAYNLGSTKGGKGVAEATGKGAMVGFQMGGPIGAAIGAGINFTSSMLGNASAKKAIKTAASALGSDVTREMALAIKKEGKEKGVSTATASLLHITEAAGQTGKSITDYSKGITALMKEVASGGKIGAEGVAELGKAFTMAQAKGGKAMVDMIQQSREMGLKIPEIAAHVQEQLSIAAQGLPGLFSAGFDMPAKAGADIFSAVFWATVREQGFSAAAASLQPAWDALTAKLGELPASLGPIASMMAMANDAAMKPAIDAVGSLQMVLDGLGKAGYMTVDAFAGIQAGAQAAFAQLTGAGADPSQALLAIMPLLSTLRDAAADYGMTLNADTLKLMEMAQASGASFATDPIDRMAAGVDRMVLGIDAMIRALGGVVPAATTAATALGQMKLPTGGAGGPSESYYTGPYIPSSGMEGFSSARGFGPRLLSQDTAFLAHAGEHVLVVPKGAGFRSAARGFADTWAPEQSEPTWSPTGPTLGSETAAEAGTAIMAELAPSLAETLSAEVGAALMPIIQKAVEQQPIQMNYNIAPTINENPLATLQAKAEMREFTNDNLLKMIRDDEAGVMTEIRRGLGMGR
jgi:hypothetical protein